MLAATVSPHNNDSEPVVESVARRPQPEAAAAPEVPSSPTKTTALGKRSAAGVDVPDASVALFREASRNCKASRL